MKYQTIFAPALVTVALISGCSSLPANNPALDAARSDYRNAESSTEVSTLAAGELKQANESLEKANAAWQKGEPLPAVDHLAYVTKQQVAIARETARQRAAEQAVANASVERDKVRLEARTNEANLAQHRAEMAKQDAQASQRSAEDSLRQANAAQQAANQATLTADAARQQAIDAESRARQLEKLLEEMAAKKTDRGMVITLGDVLFDTNQAELKTGGMRNLDKLAEFSRQYPLRQLVIEGFTDSTGSSSHNQALSEQRAAAVRSALQNKGVSNDRMSSSGFGETFPVATNDTAAGRQLNRRVEIIVSDDNGKVAPR